MGCTSKEEDAVLIQEFQSGDEKAFAKIYQQFIPLARSRVNNLIDRDCEHLKDELESEADEALWNAAKTFDLERGCLFTTYATHCIDHAIQRKKSRYREERRYIKGYLDEISEERVVNFTSDDSDEIQAIDPFPCRAESILSELKPLCKARELAILKLICEDEEVWCASGNVNNAEIARKLGISRERVRQQCVTLRTNQLLKSTIRELVPH